MENKNLTALISCFARAYHDKNNINPILKDDIASKILSREEYDLISKNMVEGIQFFNANFKGNKEEALEWIVNNQLAPSVLGRSIFAETSLQEFIKNNCYQYLVFASGYDTSCYRLKNNNLNYFEIDKDQIIEDKIKRLKNSNVDYSFINFIKCDFTNSDWINNLLNSKFDKNKKSFCSLLGISYYLSKSDFNNMLSSISKVLSLESEIVFDYPSTKESEETKKNEALATGANEQMKAKYSFKDIEELLLVNGYEIIKHLDDKDMTNEYFSSYNRLNPTKRIISPVGVCYCLAKKVR